MTHKAIQSILSILTALALVVCAGVNRTTVYADDIFPFVVLTSYSESLPVGGEFYLGAVTSNGRMPTFKSSSSRIASVNTYGLVTAKKAGTCKITAKIKNAEASCRITVKKTSLIVASRVSLYRTQTWLLPLTSSTGHTPSFRTSKRSVATVDENGLITAVKHGTATITATVDGVSKKCTVTVKQPKIRLNKSTLTLTVGESYPLSATVSSGIPPVWSTSNLNVASVDETGTVTARQKGRAYIYAREDGVKVSCIVKIIEPA